MYAGTALVPKPLSIKIFRANGFNNEIGEAKKFNTKINPMENQYGLASAKVLFKILNEEFIIKGPYLITNSKFID